MAVRPRLVPSLITLPVLILLVGLGVWQLDRQAWKSALIAELETRLAAPPLSISSLAGALPAELRYRRVRFEGRPVAGPFLWRGRTRDGEVGAQVLELYASGEGAAVIVDRGWVPYGADGEPVAFRTAVAGPVEGIVREAGWQGFGFLRPAQQPAANAWLYVDPAAMAAAGGYTGDVLTEFYLTRLPANGETEPPLARTPDVDLPDNHLQYAITWFAVAAGVLVIYVLWHLRQPRSRETQDE